ncbi:MAG: hypothetical protein QOJ19_730 [Acidimicrobiia bacterium]|nr:hypothetical protein [Acidimicrobiia bacterium]
MVARREYRRQAFFSVVEGQEHASPLDGSTYVVGKHVDGDDEVLYVHNLLVTGSNPASDEVVGRASRLGAAPQQDDLDLPEAVAGVRAFRVAEDRSSVPVLCQQLPTDGVASPEYVLLTQQTWLPGEDPEQSPPIAAVDPDRAYLGAGVVIAVIDTGVAEQPGVIEALGLGPAPLEPAVLGRRAGHRPAHDGSNVDSLADPTEPLSSGDLLLLGPAAGHGTFIHSLIKQVAPGAEVRHYRACGPLGVGRERDIVSAMQRALQEGADVINLSVGMHALKHHLDNGVTVDREPILLKRAVEAARRDHPGVAIVAAAGNSGSPDRMYPAGFDEVVGVAATDRDGYRWVHSNYGEWVDASAVGVNLRGVFVRGRENPRYDADGRAESWDHEINYARWSGTSFATPLVAAQIAVVKSAMSQRTPTTAWQAWEVLRDGSSPGDTGCGRRIYAYLPGQT